MSAYLWWFGCRFRCRFRCRFSCRLLMFFCFRFFSWFRSWLWFFWFLWCWRNRCTYALGQIIERLLCHIPNTKDHVCHIRILFVPSLVHQSVHCLWTNQIWVDNALVKLTTSSNQRLWECVRCRINVYPDTLYDFPSWLSTSKNNLFSSTTGVLQKDISVTKSMPVWLIDDCVAWRRQFP